MPGSPVWGSPQAGSPILPVNSGFPQFSSPLTSAINYAPASPALPSVGSPSTLNLTLLPTGVFSGTAGDQANAGNTINNFLVDFAVGSSETVGYPSF